MRYASIDVLRTLAIFMMVVVHFLENLGGVDWAPAGFGAPMFGFLVGVSLRIWINVQIKKGRSDEQISRSILMRGVVITVLGFLFNALVWLPQDIFNWDVLTLIGTAYFVLWCVRDLPAAVPVVICVIVFVVSPILRMHSGYAEYWIDDAYEHDWELSQIALGYLVNGYFPVFPWLIFPLVGYVAGGQAIYGNLGHRAPVGLAWRNIRPVVQVGFGFLLAGAILRLTQPYQTGEVVSQLLGGWAMFPATVEYLTDMLGGVLAAFGLALWWIDGQRYLDPFPRFLSFVQTMSKHSLSIYVFHHLLHLWPLWIYGWFAGGEVTQYWRHAMPWPAALALVLPCIALSYLLFRWVERGQRPSFESLVRRLCD